MCVYKLYPKKKLARVTHAYTYIRVRCTSESDDLKQ